MADHSEQLVDELLVLDAQRGRAPAMELLVSRWQERLWRYARRLTGDTEAAWDVTQDSWLGIVRGLARLHDPARFKPWAYQIVTHKANDWVRKAARAASHRPEAGMAPHDPDRQPTDAAAVDLETILQRLPDKSRTVLTLHYLEEFDLAEIAHILHIPRGTVKSRLYTARTEFKRLWHSDDRSQAETPAEAKGETP